MYAILIKSNGNLFLNIFGICLISIKKNLAYLPVIIYYFYNLEIQTAIVN